MKRNEQIISHHWIVKTFGGSEQCNANILAWRSALIFYLPFLLDCEFDRAGNSKSCRFARRFIIWSGHGEYVCASLKSLAFITLHIWIAPTIWMTILIIDAKRGHVFWTTTKYKSRESETRAATFFGVLLLTSFLYYS